MAKQRWRGNDEAKKKREETIKKGMEMLDQGIQNVIKSDCIKEYLDFLASFHKYSFNNTILIKMQRPDATMVMGYQAWKGKSKQKQWSRNVKKGEKGILIFGPPFYEKKTPKKDQNGNFILDENGKKVMVTERIPCKPAIRRVFDILQTEGDPIPESPAKPLFGTNKHTEELYSVLKKVIPIPVTEGDPGSGAHGVFRRDFLGNEDIVIRKENDTNQKLKTLIHEYAHYLLHGRGQEFENESRQIKEAQAESVAYVVSRYFGLDTGDYTFSYVAVWTQQNPQIIKQIGNEVQKISCLIIKQIELAVMV